MAKRPNKVGRIEADPKPPKKPFNWKAAGIGVGALMLVMAGVGGTLQYQSFISSIKAEGVAEYKLTCNKFSDSKQKVTWLECDE